MPGETQAIVRRDEPHGGGDAGAEGRSGVLTTWARFFFCFFSLLLSFFFFPSPKTACVSHFLLHILARLAGLHGITLIDHCLVISLLL